MGGAGALLAVCTVAATALGLAGCQGMGTPREILSVTNRVVQTPPGGSTPLVPYLDVTRAEPGAVRSQMARLGLTEFVVGPVTGASGMCTPMWGQSAGDDLLARRNLRAILNAGGRVHLSFGGRATQVADSLAGHCDSPKQLAGALGQFVADFSAPGRQAGLDIQLGDEQETAEIALLVAGVRELQRNHRDMGLRAVQVGLTLPADPAGGFAAGSAHLLASFLAGGVELTTVTADVGHPAARADRDRAPAAAGMGAAAVAVACRAHDDLRELYEQAGRRLSDARAWQLLGLRVTIGENPLTPDQEHPVLTPANAREIAAFASGLADSGTPMGMLSIWTFNRDHPCNYRGVLLDAVSGAQWAMPQSRCNLSGGELQYSRVLIG